jgi:hypothetical protein
MKPAVFEISEGDGQTRLICVCVPTFGDAAELEARLRQQLPRMNVRLLGRFDRVEFAASLEEFMDCATSGDFVCPGGFEGRMRRLMRES